MRLLEPRVGDQPYYVQYGWTAAPGEQVKLPDNDTLWTASADTLSDRQSGDAVVGQRRRADLPDRAVGRRQLHVQRAAAVKNATGAPVTLFPWARIRRDYTPEVAGYYILFEGLLGVVDGTLQETTYAKAKSEGEKKDGIAYDATSTGGWAGITDKYWLTALVPDQSVATTVNFRHIERERRPLSGRLRHAGAADASRRAATASLAVACCSPAPRSCRCCDPYEERLAIPRFD